MYYILPQAKKVNCLFETKLLNTAIQQPKINIIAIFFDINVKKINHSILCMKILETAFARKWSDFAIKMDGEGVDFNLHWEEEVVVKVKYKCVHECSDILFSFCM